MQLPFPERIPLPSVFFFTGTLCVVQLLEGTSGIFSLGCMGFIIVAALAFNFTGGFTQPSGSYVFFFSTLSLIVGLCWKAILGEPANSNLEDPVLTISVYFGAICSLFVAIVISRRLRAKHAILKDMVNDSNMQHATVGCMITGLLIFVFNVFAERESGSVISALNQINQFLPLAIVLGTIHAIRRSRGTRSVNIPVFLSGLFMFGTGLFGFSKQGIITPFICWLMAAASQRYKVSRTQIGIGLFATFFIFHYLVPYAQYGRSFREESSAANFDVVVSMLSNLGEVREQYLGASDDSEQDMLYGYYNNEPQGFFDRLQMIGIDDALITYKHQTGFDGLTPIFQDFQNLVPHFIWKDKPTFFHQNSLAHEIGLLGEEDFTTGVSFSPASISYTCLGWAGVLLLAPILWIVLFALFDSLCGDLRRVPWGLLVAVIYAHIAPEAGLGGVIYMYTYTTFAIVFAAVLGAYVMPVVGTFFIGPEGILIRRGVNIRGIPGRVLRLTSREN